MSDKRIHLIFKTHLDIGFTDHAAKVRRQYHEQFIPQAISTGEHFHAENPDRPLFIWTTGAWLIWDHLHSQSPERVKRLEQAIERGLITWHALPFTTHTELMSPALFRAGLSYAQELDRRFGRITSAAKMTDVPGHTLGMVPLLAEAGVRFLHLGVNTASPVPEVPPIFRWRAPDGSEVVVMYQNSYGATDFPAGADVGLSFAHTNDNIGPQSVGQTVEALRHLRHEQPDAEIIASTLDAFGAEMWARREQFPVVTEEIGDSWIYGTASDPEKLARFRALQRVYDSFEEALTPERLAFGRGLAMVAEHTWGVDIKTYLRDETAWDRPDFEQARQTDYRFHYAEQSWAEQRGYLDTAVAELAPADQAIADKALRELAPGAEPEVRDGAELRDGGWSAVLDPVTGDIASITAPDGRVLAGRDGALMGYRHESYDWAALQQHLGSYLQHRQDWAILDHDKPGLDRARTARTASFAPKLTGVGSERLAVSTLPEDAHRDLGAPERVELAIRSIDEQRLEIRLTLRNKPANRMPEAGFLSFTPDAASPWALRKLEHWNEAENIVRGGGGQLQAVEAVSAGSGEGRIELQLLDSALVGPALSPFLPFQAERPDFSAGVRCNLYNNKWGTNFAMWWEGSLVFRVVLTLRSTRP
ncbi:MAG TPA: DUF5054 domain-containing protein [Devosia sp.]|jgi:hypothetical protein|nr:DUF5054 domain-containing protein [Devosia sp.]